MRPFAGIFALVALSAAAPIVVDPVERSTEISDASLVDRRDFPPHGPPHVIVEEPTVVEPTVVEKPTVVNTSSGSLLDAAVDVSLKR